MADRLPGLAIIAAAPWRWLQTRGGRLQATNKWVAGAVGVHLICAAALVPVTSHPYDLAVLSGNAEAWLRWGFTPLFNWKFGIDYAALAGLAQAVRALLAGLGVPGVPALHIAWKLPLVASDLVTAVLIYRLGMIIAPKRAGALAALWLLNPVALWVSAGHGQIEALAIMLVFLALLLTLKGRLFSAGVVTGLGVGLEYFPLAVACCVLLWYGAGQLSGRRPLLSYGLGLGTSIALCFGPLMVDPITRSTLASGLISTGGYDSNFSQSLLAVWAWFGQDWSAIWPATFVGVSAISLVLAWRFAARRPDAGFVFVSAVTISAVLLDANSSPQFALIASAGLWLLALVAPISPVAMIAVPMAGLATGLVLVDNGKNSANTYFYDAWFRSETTLWPIPQSAAIAVFLGRVFSAGLIAILLLAALRTHRTSARSWMIGLGSGVALCAVLGIWAAQPHIWQAAFATTPAADVPDFDRFIATRSGTLTAAPDGETGDVAYQDALVAASLGSSVLPSSDLAVTAAPLFQREIAGDARPWSVWPDPGVTLDHWDVVGPSLTSIWIEILVGSPDWATAAPLEPSHLTITVNGAPIQSRAVGGVTNGWAIVDFKVPTSMVTDRGLIELSLQPSSLLWNGSLAGPWIRVLPAQGTISVTADENTKSLPFDLDSTGTGYVVGLPLKRRFAVSLDSGSLPSFHLLGADLRWRDTSTSWMRNPILLAVGASYLAITCIAAWAAVRELLSLPRPASL